MVQLLVAAVVARPIFGPAAAWRTEYWLQERVEEATIIWLPTMAQMEAVASAVLHYLKSTLMEPFQVAALRHPVELPPAVAQDIPATQDH